MSWALEERFLPPKDSGVPPVGTYNPKFPERALGGTFRKCERFQDQSRVISARRTAAMKGAQASGGSLDNVNQNHEEILKAKMAMEKTLATQKQQIAQLEMTLTQGNIKLKQMNKEHITLKMQLDKDQKSITLLLGKLSVKEVQVEEVASSNLTIKEHFDDVIGKLNLMRDEFVLSQSVSQQSERKNEEKLHSLIHELTISDDGNKDIKAANMAIEAKMAIRNKKLENLQLEFNRMTRHYEEQQMLDYQEHSESKSLAGEYYENIVATEETLRQVCDELVRVKEGDFERHYEEVMLILKPLEEQVAVHMHERDVAYEEIQELSSKYFDIMGNYNIEQRIMHLMDLKDENAELKEEVKQYKSLLKEKEKELDTLKTKRTVRLQSVMLARGKENADSSMTK